MKPRQKLILLALLFVLFLRQSANANDDSRPTPNPKTQPNILWLSAEDIGPQLACYGDLTAKTPNLDALAKRGMVYDLAWSNYPVCAPARTTIITGMYAASNGAGNMRCSSELPDSIQMFPQLLRESGYTCFNNSKEDYNTPANNQVWDLSSGKAHYKNGEPGKPFFSVFNNTQTHESKIRTRPHQQIVSPASVELCPYWPDVPEVREDWAQYYDNLISLDQWVGQKLEQLEALGHAEDTIVVFFGDHGSGMARHKRYVGDSGMRVPLIVYVPEGLRSLAPADYVPGGRSSRPTAFVDLAPTMLSLAGIEAPDFIQGRAFMGPHQKEAAEFLFGFRDRMDERIDLSRSVRDQRYLYIRNFMTFLPAGQTLDYQMLTPSTAVWKRQFEAGKTNKVQSQFWNLHPAEELYDLSVDSYETRNLVNDPAHRNDLNRLRNALRDQVIAVRDSGFIPESELHQIRQKQTVNVFCSDPERFPVAEIYDLACAASSGREIELAALVSAAQSANPVKRYWAALGILSRGSDVVGANQALLVTLLDDPSSAVAIVAGEALSLYGSPENRLAALNLLANQADLNRSDFYSAIQSLNVIDRLDSIADPILDRIRTVPQKAPSIARSGNYVERLLVHLFGKTPDQQ